MAIQIRRGSKAEWELNNSNIVAGEPAIALDTGDVFVGTGSGTYVELSSTDYVDAIGSQINNLNSALNGRVLVAPTWESGRYNPSTGAKQSTSGFIRTSNKIPYADNIVVVFSNHKTDNVRCRVAFYDSEDSFIGMSDFIARAFMLKDIAPNSTDSFTISATGVSGNITTDYGECFLLTDWHSTLLPEDPDILNRIKELSVIEDYEATLISGKAVVEDGTESASEAWSVTDYISVLPKSKIMVKTHLLGHGSICIYNNTKECIGYIDSSYGTTSIYSYYFTLPEDARYIRCSCRIESAEKFKVVQGIVNGVNDLYDNIGQFVNIKNITVESNTTYSFDITRSENSESMIIYADAKFSRASSVTDYPRIQFGIVTDRGFDRPTTWYRIGKEDEFEQHEWRVPAYFWDNRKVTVTIYVPTGCELTIRNLRNYYNNFVFRTTDGLRFFGRSGTCNIAPDLSMASLQMSYRHGYDTFVVIPKISSDGVWFAYHDDTWDISTTVLRNPDGTVITDETYNGEYFHNIPYSYLEQFDWGMRWGEPAFTGTKGMKLEDYFEFCAKTGISPRFSMHPANGVNTTENLTSLKNLVNKYGLLKKLTILVNNIAQIFPVFGNDIAGYCFGNSTEATWDGVSRIDDAFTKAQSAKETYGITVPICCGMWADGIFSDLDKAKTLVADIRDAGFDAGIFEYTHTGIDGSSHRMLWSDDIRWLASIGVTEYTTDYHTSNGLNW